VERISKPNRETSKVVIIDDLDRILVLTRSDREDTRQGEPDLVGGKFDESETDPLKVMLREAGMEIPGTTLYNVTPLHEVDKTDETTGLRSVTYIYAANAVYPEGGIILSEEHDRADLVPRELFHHLRIQRKYRDAVAAGGVILDNLVESAREAADHALVELDFLELQAA
jgi:hypothetical protein